MSNYLYKFRGLSLQDKWCYGSLLQIHDKFFLTSLEGEYEEVFKDSIGQLYTITVNDEEVYEGDFVCAYLSGNIVNVGLAGRDKIYWYGDANVNEFSLSGYNKHEGFKVLSWVKDEIWIFPCKGDLKVIAHILGTYMTSREQCQFIFLDDVLAWFYQEESLREFWSLRGITPNVLFAQLHCPLG
jgi:hypothetical protein